MNYELTGKLTEKFDVLSLSEKFRKREFIVEIIDKKNEGNSYPELIKLQLTNDRCGLLDSIPLKAEVKVSFNLKGRKYEKDGN